MGYATPMFQKVLCCTGGVGGVNENSKVEQKNHEILKSIKKVDYVQKSLRNDHRKNL